MPRFELFVSGDSNPRSAPDERRTILRVQRGDREHFRHLVDAYRDAVFSLVMRQVGERGLAEDLTQEIFIKAFRGIGYFRFEASFLTWLTCIAVNHLNSHFASRSFRERKATQLIDAIPDRGDDSHDERNRTQELSERLRAALQELSPVHREVVVLVGLEGKSYEETAGILCIPLGTVRSRLNKARKMLKELMGRGQS